MNNPGLIYGVNISMVTKNTHNNKYSTSSTIHSGIIDVHRNIKQTQQFSS